MTMDLVVEFGESEQIDRGAPVPGNIDTDVSAFCQVNLGVDAATNAQRQDQETDSHDQCFT